MSMTANARMTNELYAQKNIADWVPAQRLRLLSDSHSLIHSCSERLPIMQAEPTKPVPETLKLGAR